MNNPFNKLVDLKEIIKRKNELDLPDSKQLFELSGYGIDTAYQCLKSKLHDDDDLLVSANKLRPRYQTLKPIEYEKFQIDPNLYDLPFKFFVYPFGVGHFKELRNNLDKSVKIIDIISMIKNNNIDKKINVNNFKTQFIQNIYFHNYIFKSRFETKEETGSLNYVFTSNSYKKFLDLIKQTEFYYWLDQDLQLKNSFKNVSIEMLNKTKNWKPNTFEQFKFELSRIPRKIGLDKKIINIDHKDYPQKILNLSIYFLAAATTSQNIFEKCEDLHKYGLRRILDLKLLLHALPVFNSTKVQKLFRKLTS